MIDLSAVRGWMQHHRTRALLYILLALFVFVLAVATLVAGSGGRGLLFRLADSAAFHHLSEEVGVVYRIDSVRICWRPHLGVEVSGIDFNLVQEPVRGHLDRAALFLNGGVSATGLEIDTDAVPNAISVASIQSDLTFLRAEVTGIRVPLSESGRSHLSTQSIAADGFTAHGSPQSIGLNRLAVDGTEVLMQRNADSSLDLTALPSLQALGASLSRVEQTIIGNLSQVLGRFRRLLAIAIACTLLLFAFVKMCAARAIGCTPGWIALAVAVVLVPLTCYALLFGRVSLRTFLLLTLVVSILVAIGMWLRLYRLASEWHQRWEPFAVDVISTAVVVPLLVAYGILAIGLAAPREFSVSHTAVQNSHVSVQDGATNTELVGLSIPEFLNEGLLLSLPAPRASINIGRSRFNGTITSRFPELQKLEWLPAAWSGPTSVSFCGKVRDRATPESPAHLDRCAGDGSNRPVVDADVVAGVLLSPFELTYSAKTQVQRNSNRVTFDADGDSQSIRITRIASGGNPQLQFDDAWATINFHPRFSGTLSLQDLRARTGGVRLSAVLVDADFSSSGVSGSPDLQARIAVRGASAQKNGQTVAIEKTSLRFTRSAVGGNITALADLGQAVLNGVHAGDPDPWLHAEFPYITLQTKGLLSEGVIPQNFTGETSFTVARLPQPSLRDRDTAFWTDAPLHFGVDVWKGTLRVADQTVTMHQSIFTQAPKSMTVNVGATGQLVSASPINARADARLLIPRLALDLSPAQLELNNLGGMVHAVLKEGVTSFSSQYDSDWSTITTDGSPGRLPQLKKVSEFALETHGFMPRLPDLQEGGQTSTNPGAGLPSLPKQIEFRLQGRWPASSSAPLVEVLSPSGRGLRVADIKSLVTKLDVPDSKLKTLTTQIHASRIQTADGKGSLTLDSNTEIRGSEVRASVAIPFSLGGRLALRLEQAPQRLGIELADPLPAGHLLTELEPFLQQAGFQLAGVTSEAEIKTFRVLASLSNDRTLTGVEGELEVAPSLLASLDLPRLFPDRSLPFQKLEVRLPKDPAGRIRFKMLRTPEPNSTEITLALDHLLLLGLDSEARRYQGEFSLTSKATALLGDKNNPEINPIWQKLVASASDLSGQARNCFNTFGPGFNPGPNIRNVIWRLDLHNRDGEPALSVESDKLSLALSGAISDIGWQAHEQKERSELNSHFEVTTDFRMHNGELVADGYVPIQIGLRVEEQPARIVSVRLPFVAILAEHLRPDASADWLWDTGYYDSFWKDYQPSRANHQISVIDTPELTLNSISIQQLRIPSEPLRMALGHSGTLQLDMPIASQVLFGRSQGRLQANVRWPEPHRSPPENAVLLNARLAMDFSKLQAGAIRRAVPDGGLPMVEDEIEGRMNLRTDDYALNSETLRRLAAGVVRAEDLEHVSARANFASSRSDPHVKARIQALGTVQVKDLNSILSAIAQDLKVHFPPQSMVYNSMSLNFETSKGLVTTHPSLFELRGIEFYSTRQLELRGNVQLNIGARTEPVSLMSLFNLGKTLISTEVADGVKDAR